MIGRTLSRSTLFQVQAAVCSPEGLDPSGMVDVLAVAQPMVAHLGAEARQQLHEVIGAVAGEGQPGHIRVCSVDLSISERGEVETAIKRPYPADVDFPDRSGRLDRGAAEKIGGLVRAALASAGCDQWLALNWKGLAPEGWKLTATVDIHPDRPTSAIGFHRDGIAHCGLVLLVYAQEGAGPEFVRIPVEPQAEEILRASLPPALVEGTLHAMRQLGASDLILHTKVADGQVVAFFDPIIDHTTPNLETRSMSRYELAEAADLFLEAAPRDAELERDLDRLCESFLDNISELQPALYLQDLLASEWRKGFPALSDAHWKGLYTIMGRFPMDATSHALCQPQECAHDARPTKIFPEALRTRVLPRTYSGELNADPSLKASSRNDPSAKRPPFVRIQLKSVREDMVPPSIELEFPEEQLSLEENLSLKTGLSRSEPDVAQEIGPASVAPLESVVNKTSVVDSEPQIYVCDEAAGDREDVGLGLPLGTAGPAIHLSDQNDFAEVKVGQQVGGAVDASGTPPGFTTSQRGDGTVIAAMQIGSTTWIRYYFAHIKDGLWSAENAAALASAIDDPSNCWIAMSTNAPHTMHALLAKINEPFGKADKIPVENALFYGTRNDTFGLRLAGGMIGQRTLDP